MQASNERERLEANQKKIEKEIRKHEKELKKKGILPEEPEPETAVYPEPKIIDSSAAIPDRSKPSLAELKGKGRDKEQVLAIAGQHIENYVLPSVKLLEPIDLEGRKAADPAELKLIQHVLIDTLKQFNIEASPGDITRGPTITGTNFIPREESAWIRSRVWSAILHARPGQNELTFWRRSPARIRSESKLRIRKRSKSRSERSWNRTNGRRPNTEFRSCWAKDVYGKIILGDMAQMPHALVAGTTGSGKSVCINAIIASILFKFSPDDLRFVMIDPKVVEMQMYNALPHLVMPVVTDPKKVLLALRWVVNEMENRYKIFAKVGVRNVTGFNARPKPKSQRELDLENETEESAEAGRSSREPENSPTPIVVPRDDDLIIPEQMPYIVVIIDELADLMQTAPADVESAIARITQMARAAGIHMIVATQTPRADIVTGVIKANIPTRIAFQVASALDSRVILDENGAERLVGTGRYVLSAARNFAANPLPRCPGHGRRDSATGGVRFCPRSCRRSIRPSRISSSPQGKWRRKSAKKTRCLSRSAWKLFVRRSGRPLQCSSGGCASATPALLGWLIFWSAEAF